MGSKSAKRCAQFLIDRNEGKMVRDFGSGLTVDELIGMPAWHLDRLDLPPGVTFITVSDAARVMVEAGLESCVLAELWEDGHTVWHSIETHEPAMVTPSGQLIRTK